MRYEPKKPFIKLGCIESDYKMMAMVDMPLGTTFINASHLPESVKNNCAGNFALYQKVRMPSNISSTDCPRDVPYDRFANSFAVNLRNGNIYNLAIREGCPDGMAKGFIVTTCITFDFDKE